MYLWMRRSMWLVILGGLLVAGGCEDNRTGVVIETQKRRGFFNSGFESQVSIRRPDGSTTKIGHVGNPFYVITFVEVPAGNIGYVDPRLEQFAKQFELDSVVVIQMSLPEKKKTFSQEELDEANFYPIRLTNLSRFFDPDRRAWKVFGEPDCKTLMVVDRRGLFGTRDSQGTLDDPAETIRRIRRLQGDWKNEQKEFGRNN
ncbi:MAG: hypothetical protein GY794_23050 [bacterium]|nr:hypothetical protein [bacterium]